MSRFTLIFMGIVLAFDVLSASNCRALDGDTVQCGGERIRIQGVYATEKNEPGGGQARENLQRKLDSGEIKVMRHGKDKYGRTIGDIYVNDRKMTQSDIGPKAGRGTSGTAKQPKATVAGAGVTGSGASAKPSKPKSIGSSASSTPRGSTGKSGAIASGNKSSFASGPKSSSTRSPGAGSGRASTSGRSASGSQGYSPGRSSSGSRSSRGGSRGGGWRR